MESLTIMIVDRLLWCVFIGQVWHLCLVLFSSGTHLCFLMFIYLKSTWQRVGSATYMPHSQQRHAYKSNTHKIRRNLKTKYSDCKKEKENNDQYLVCIPRLTLPKDLLNNNNDSKLTMLGGRLFQTLIICSLKMFLHINTTMVDAEFIWVPARCSTAATPRLFKRVWWLLCAIFVEWCLTGHSLPVCKRHTRSYTCMRVAVISVIDSMSFTRQHSYAVALGPSVCLSVTS